MEGCCERILIFVEWHGGRKFIFMDGYGIRILIFMKGMEEGNSYLWRGVVEGY